jgi:hypothetical protein
MHRNTISETMRLYASAFTMMVRVTIVGPHAPARRAIAAHGR